MVKESTINVKLDMNKIKTLQNQETHEWLKVKGT